MYLAACTRPDISFAMTYLSLKLVDIAHYLNSRSSIVWVSNKVVTTQTTRDLSSSAQLYGSITF
jgi:hypothetical protein